MTIPNIDIRPNWSAMQSVYLDKGLLTAVEFDQLVERAIQVSALKVLNRSWSIALQILGEHRQLPLEAHYEALSAGYGFPYQGIESFHVQLIDKGILPPWTLNRSFIHRIPEQRLLIGELMKRMGLITETELEVGLAIQRGILQEVGAKVALGAILLSSTNLSYPDFFQALGAQVKVPFVSLNESAAKIFAAQAAEWAAGEASSTPAA